MSIGPPSWTFPARPTAVASPGKGPASTKGQVGPLQTQLSIDSGVADVRDSVASTAAGQQQEGAYPTTHAPPRLSYASVPRCPGLEPANTSAGNPDAQ